MRLINAQNQHTAAVVQNRHPAFKITLFQLRDILDNHDTVNLAGTDRCDFPIPVRDYAKCRKFVKEKVDRDRKLSVRRMDVRIIDQIDKCHGEKQRNNESEGYIRVREVKIIYTWDLAGLGKIDIIRRKDIAQQRIVQKLDACSEMCNDVSGQVSGCPLKIHVKPCTCFFSGCNMLMAEQAVQEIDPTRVLKKLMDRLNCFLLGRIFFSLQDSKDQRTQERAARSGVNVIPL